MPWRKLKVGALESGASLSIFTVHLPRSLPWTFETWFAEGLHVAYLSNTQVVELSVLWAGYHLAEFAAAVAYSSSFAVYLHAYPDVASTSFCPG